MLCIRRLVTALVATGLILTNAFGGEGTDSAEQPTSISADPRLHLATAGSNPDQSKAGDAKPRFDVDQRQLDTLEWQDAIAKALNHQAGRGYYTLLRVRVDDTPGEQIQAQATKLKDFTEEYHGAGGAFHVLKSGEFLLWEHINTDRRRKGRDPLQLGAVSHGHCELWVDVPQAGVLNVLGDVVLHRCPVEEMGVLSIRLHGVQDPPKAGLMIGPVVVGGPYGKRFLFDTSKDFELHLPPGNYKLLLPNFNLVTSRWEATVTSQETTRMEFDVDVAARTAVQRLEKEKSEP